MILNNIKTILKKNITTILTVSLLGVIMVIGSCAMAPRVTLQGHTISTLTGQRSMWEHRTLGRQIEYSITFGRRARLIREVMACATLRTDGQVFHSWQAQKLLTKLRSQETLDSEFYLNLDLMLRRCSQTRWFQYHQTTLSSSNQYKTVWKDPKPSYPIRFRQEDLPEILCAPPRRKKTNNRVWTQQSTGRIQETTRMMGRSSGYLSTMNRVNGKGRTTSSITGGSRKRVLGSEQK